MPNPITDVSEFSDVTSPSTGEPANQGTFAAGIQALANRTRWLLDHLGGDITLAVNTVLGRRSTGATGGQPVTDFSFNQLALATAVAQADALHTRGTTVASASTTNIAGASGLFVHISGVTTINGFGTAPAGVMRIITFDGALTINHSPTGIILPGGENFLTAAGASGLVVSEGAGVWRLISWQAPSSLNTGLVREVRRTFNYNDVDVFIASTSASIQLAEVPGRTLLLTAYAEGMTSWGDGDGPISNVELTLSTSMHNTTALALNGAPAPDPTLLEGLPTAPLPVNSDASAQGIIVNIAVTGANLNALTVGTVTVVVAYVLPAITDVTP